MAVTAFNIATEDQVCCILNVLNDDKLILEIRSLPIDKQDEVEF